MKIEDKNVITCKVCGEKIEVKNNVSTSILISVIAIISLIVLYKIYKNIFIHGNILGAYKIAKLIIYYGLIVILIVVFAIIKCIKGGGHCKCPKCHTKYKFNKYEYTNKVFDKENA